MVNPDQIEKKEFTVRRVKGYDPGEVDDFLDEVVASYRDVLAQLHAAQDANRLRSASTQQLPTIVTPPVQNDAIGDVARLLSVAQQAADQQAADAKAAADKVIADAQLAGGRVVADANTQAAQIVAEGTSQRNEIVGALEVQRTELQSKVDALTAEHETVRGRLTAALNTLGGATNG